MRAFWQRVYVARAPLRTLNVRFHDDWASLPFSQEVASEWEKESMVDVNSEINISKQPAVLREVAFV